MRKLSFETFLKRYLWDVSGKKTLSIHSLAELSKNNVRVFDSLILYCVLNNKKNVLLKYIDLEKNPELKNLNKDNYLDDMFSNYSFSKIHDSYLKKSNEVEYDNQIKSMIRKNILTMMKEKGITNYRIYKDLNANAGNINDYLKNNNTKKVSLKMVNKIFNYCLFF